MELMRLVEAKKGEFHKIYQSPLKETTLQSHMRIHNNIITESTQNFHNKKYFPLHCIAYIKIIQNPGFN